MKYDLFLDNSNSLDPFHEMELRTINDKEELKNIFVEKNTFLKSNSSTGLINSNFNQTLNLAARKDNQSSFLDNFGLPIIPDLNK
jgi:hypothetical protein